MVHFQFEVLLGPQDGHRVDDLTSGVAQQGEAPLRGVVGAQLGQLALQPSQAFMLEQLIFHRWTAVAKFHGERDILRRPGLRAVRPGLRAVRPGLPIVAGPSGP